MSTKTNTYLDRPSLWVAITTAILILVIVTLGILARFLLDELASRIVLISLIILLSILGIAALTYLEMRRRKVVKQNNRTTLKNGYYYKNINPSAPKDPNWEYSNRDTMPVNT